MRVRFSRLLLLLLVVVLTGVYVGRRSTPDAPNVAKPPGEWVFVTPPLGYVPRPIREYVTSEEQEIVGRIQSMIDEMEIADTTSIESGQVKWYVEPSAAKSPTYLLQRKILFALDRSLDGRVEFIRNWPVTIIVARTQKYIRRTLRRLGCEPNLSWTNGVVLMGASVCNRHFVISNITGFLFLVRADQVITSAMERRKEVPLAKVPYRIVMRNSSGLAHEYMHIWRAAGMKGQVPPDEPAWFREGFAEFWAGVANVLAYPRRIPYLTHHVTRLRDFVDWANMCRSSLSRYRYLESVANGCEYHVGALAVEYLYAKYSSLTLTLDALARSGEYPTFAEGFLASYGISLSDFETEADRYIDSLRQVELAT